MDEGRKRTLGVIAAIFICRKLKVLEGKSSPALKDGLALSALAVALDAIKRL